MELEETIKDLKDKIWLIKSGNISGKENFERLGNEIDTVLKELDNRISKERIKSIVDYYKKMSANKNTFRWIIADLEKLLNKE